MVPTLPVVRSIEGPIFVAALLHAHATELKENKRFVVFNQLSTSKYCPTSASAVCYSKALLA
jgi:hypothetical protein